MEGILLLLKTLSALGITLPQMILLLEKYGPLIEKLVPMAKVLIAMVKAFMLKFGIPAFDALKNAADIQLNIRPATPEEMETLHPVGLEPDDNHTWRYRMDG